MVYELVKEDKGRYSPEHVWKENKVAELLKQEISHEPDTHAVTHDNETDVYEVWFREGWGDGLDDILSSLHIRNLGKIVIMPVNMQLTYKSPKDRWSREDVVRIKHFFMPLMNKEMQSCLESKLRIIEIDEDELEESKLEKLRARLKAELKSVLEN